MTMQILSDRHTLPAHTGSERELLLRIIAPKAPSDAAPTPLQLSFALDCSGSMAGERIHLSRLAVLKALKLLGPDDSAALTTFAYSGNTIRSLTRVDEAGSMKLRNGLQHTMADGATNLFEGWDLAARALDDCQGIARVLLLSDGRANRGLTDMGQIRGLVAKAACRGIRTSVLGVGDDYDDDLLHSISAAGQGNFYFAESESQIPAFVTQEVNESRQIVARGVELHVELPPGASMKILGDWPTSTVNERKLIHLPDLVSEQMVEVGIVLKFPAFATDERVRVGLKIASHAGWGEDTELIYSVGNAENQPQNDELLLAMSHLRVQEATIEAVRRHRRGERQRAAQVFEDLELVLYRRGIDPDEHPDLFALMRQQGERMRQEIQESERKELTHTSTMGLRTRSRDSKPRRSED